MLNPGRNQGSYQGNSGEGSTESSDQITSLDGHHGLNFGMTCLSLFHSCSFPGLGFSMPSKKYQRDALGPANFKLTSTVVCNAGGIHGSAELSDSAGGAMISSTVTNTNGPSQRITFRENDRDKAEYCVGEKVDANERMLAALECKSFLALS
jgi:hypothetical protein